MSTVDVVLTDCYKKINITDKQTYLFLPGLNNSHNLNYDDSFNFCIKDVEYLCRFLKEALSTISEHMKTPNLRQDEVALLFKHTWSQITHLTSRKLFGNLA